MSAKTARPKPRKMWANYYSNGIPFVYDARQTAAASAAHDAQHVAVPGVFIPLDDVDALVQTATRAYLDHTLDFYDNRIRAALAAIGVSSRGRAKKGRK